MADQITKKDLEETATAVVSAVDDKIEATQLNMNYRFGKLEERMDVFDRKLDKLTTTLDNFLKRLTNFEDELAIIKTEVHKLKKAVKEKLGIDI